MRERETRVATAGAFGLWRGAKGASLRPGRLAGSLFAAFAAVALAAGPASADDGERRLVVSCDDSGCLLAHAVVDSDGDGVCDADERLAGTDPHDPTSVPPLRRLVELAAKDSLPSFENGFATFVVLPPDITAKRLPEGAPDPIGAFPLRGRKDSLAALGISGELLGAHGIDVSVSGLTIGRGDENAGEPPVRVGGIDVRLISAGDDDDLAPLTKLPSWTGTTFYTNSDGDLVTSRRYSDNSCDNAVTGSDGVTRGEHVTSDGRQTSTSESTASQREEGGSRVTEYTSKTYDANLNTTSTTHVVSTTNDAGVTTTVGTTTEYQRDENGDATETTVTTTVTVKDKDNKTLAQGSQTQKCDANGQNCSSPYVNPDADQPTVLTPEMVDHTLRKLGSAVTTLPGWTAPGEGTPRDPSDPGTIALVDGELHDVVILADVPRLTHAQPEARPDLPSPRDAADPKSPGWPH